MSSYIETYYIAIKRGAVTVSKKIERQYAKLVDDIKNPNYGYVFDERRAEKPIRFIEKFCKHSKGEWAGESVKLELLILFLASIDVSGYAGNIAIESS